MNSSSTPNSSTSLDEGRLPIGTSLVNGKYVIEQYLASGGFGNTYVATDTAFDEKVVIKEHFLKGKCGRSPQTQMVDITLTENRRDFDASREKFRKEARRLRQAQQSAYRACVRSFRRKRYDLLRDGLYRGRKPLGTIEAYR